jgi:hypothetical protein
MILKEEKLEREALALLTPEKRTKFDEDEAVKLSLGRRDCTSGKGSAKREKSRLKALKVQFSNLLYILLTYFK